MDMLQLAQQLAAAAQDAQRVLTEAKEYEAKLKTLRDAIEGTQQVKGQKEAELVAILDQLKAAKAELAQAQARVARIKERLAEV